MSKNVTQETLDLMKASLDPANDIHKSITLASGLVAYDLQAPAKNLYPVYTPLRNRIPRVAGGVGTATNWRRVSAITGSGYDAQGWIPEGQRSGRMSYTTASKAASYVTLGEEDSVTFEAVNAGRTFEDLRATMSLRLLQKMMLKEENAIIGGNASLTVSAPGTITTSASGSGGTLGAATYVVYCVALTLEGYFNSSVAAGVATRQTVTGADGSTYVINGGSSNKSAASGGQVVSSGQTLFGSVPAVQGAVAYAWYIGTSGAEKLEMITTINSFAKSTALIGGAQQAATAITQDNSTNTGAFDGLLYSAWAAGSGAVQTVQATGVAGTGTTLTASGRGSVNEIDAALKAQWDQYQLSATVIYVNSQELTNITTKVIGTGNAALIRYMGEANANSFSNLVAGGLVSMYFNPYMPDGGRLIPIRIHPKVPAGTILLQCEDLPIYYQNNEVANVAEIKTRQDYYQIDWPLRTRQYETGVYAEEVLAVYAPFAMATITNIANG